MKLKTEKRWKNKPMRDMVKNGRDEEDTQGRKKWKQKRKDVFEGKETLTMRKLHLKK